MTKQAESITLEKEGQSAIWCLSDVRLAPVETRLVLPNQLHDWYHLQSVQVKRGWRRWFTAGPVPISTALRIHIRLELRMLPDGGFGLFRKSVAFNAVNRAALERFTLANAVLDSSDIDGCALMHFKDTSSLQADSWTEFTCDDTGRGRYYRRADSIGVVVQMRGRRRASPRLARTERE